MSNSKSSAQNAANNAGESQCDENSYCYKDEKGRVVCLDLNSEEGKKKAREHAHKHRNQFQQGVCPTNLSQFTEEIGDSSTGIIWARAGLVERRIGQIKGYHQSEWEENIPYLDNNYEGFSEYKRRVSASEICYRGTIPPDEKQALTKRCEFRQSAKALGANADILEPGFQCCYYPEGHPYAGQLSDSSSFDFHSPGGYSSEHQILDVESHDELGGNYEYSKGMSSGNDIRPMTEPELEQQKEENLEYRLRRWHEKSDFPGPPPKPFPKPK